jgi:Ran GTPase-activating protein (RanGAP) involved in mRNA processing and transport
LHTLDLSWNDLAYYGISALAEHAARHWLQLQTLNLTQNSLRDAGVTDLAQHAKGNWPQLQTLILANNELGTAGVEPWQSTQLATGPGYRAWTSARTI